MENSTGSPSILRFSYQIPRFQRTTASQNETSSKAVTNMRRHLTVQGLERVSFNAMRPLPWNAAFESPCERDRKSIFVF